jgi:hypothetical protein
MREWFWCHHNAAYMWYVKDTQLSTYTRRIVVLWTRGWCQSGVRLEVRGQEVGNGVGVGVGDGMEEEHYLEGARLHKEKYRVKLG